MSDSKKTVTVPVVKFGNDRTELTVTSKTDNPPTYQDVKDAIEGADGKHVCVFGEPIDEHLEEPVKADVTVFIAPKKIAQGGGDILCGFITGP